MYTLALVSLRPGPSLIHDRTIAVVQPTCWKIQYFRERASKVFTEHYLDSISMSFNSLYY